MILSPEQDFPCKDDWTLKYAAQFSLCKYTPTAAPHIVYHLLSSEKKKKKTHPHTLACLDTSSFWKCSQLPRLHTSIPGAFPLSPKIASHICDQWRSQCSTGLLARHSSPHTLYLNLCSTMIYQIILHATLRQLGYVFLEAIGRSFRAEGECCSLCTCACFVG